MKHHHRFNVLFILAAVLVHLSSVTRAKEIQPEHPPKIVVFITVDQLRHDYLTRFEGFFRFGLHRLLKQGFSFSRAHHYHSSTSTGPGHATLASGAVPGRSGIVDNSWFDRDKGAPVNCVEDREAPLIGSDSTGRSPRNLLVPAMSDWMKNGDPKSKVYSVSRKDRGAILPSGHRGDGAFWYNGRNGRFITSSYYTTELPDWLDRFHERNIPDSYFGKMWQASPLDESMARAAGALDIDRGAFPDQFPHAIGSASFFPNESFYAAFGGTPFMDGYLVEMAKALVEGEGLGKDEHLDFLGMSFSALDSVGHTYGPHSREALDALIKLDRYIGDFFDFLDAQVGMDSVVVSLSSDHGVMPLPELLKQQGVEASRLTSQEIGCFQQTMERFSSEMGEDDWLLQGYYLNYETLGRRNLLRSQVEKKLGTLLARCESVRRVWTRSELESEPEDVVDDPYFQLYRNSFHPRRSPDLFVQLEKYRLGSTGYGTSHGTAYEYDTHVPIVILVPGVQGHPVAETIHTIDLAPTLAAILGIPAPEEVDGVDRRGLMSKGFPQP